MIWIQNLVRFIEELGGEAAAAPSAYFIGWFDGREIRQLLGSRSVIALVDLIERGYWGQTFEFIRENGTAKSGRIEEKFPLFSVSISHEGEGCGNILEIMHILQRDTDIFLFVRTNPTLSCPSLIAEAMAAEIERVTGGPVVSVTYDCTESRQRLENSTVIYSW